MSHSTPPRGLELFGEAWKRCRLDIGRADSRLDPGSNTSSRRDTRQTLCACCAQPLRRRRDPATENPGPSDEICTASQKAILCPQDGDEEGPKPLALLTDNVPKSKAPWMWCPNGWKAEGKTTMFAFHPCIDHEHHCDHEQCVNLCNPCLQMTQGTAFQWALISPDHPFHLLEPWNDICTIINNGRNCGFGKLLASLAQNKDKSVLNLEHRRFGGICWLAVRFKVSECRQMLEIAVLEDKGEVWNTMGKYSLSCSPGTMTCSSGIFFADILSD